MPSSVVRTTTPGSNGIHCPASYLAIFLPLRIIKRPLPSYSIRSSGSLISEPLVTSESTDVDAAHVSCLFFQSGSCDIWQGNSPDSSSYEWTFGTFHTNLLA